MAPRDRRRIRRWSPRRSRSVAHRAVNGEDSECAEDGSDEPGARASRTVPTDGTAEDPGHDGARDSEQRRDEEPGRITAGHDEARDRTDHEADKQGDDETHETSPRFGASGWAD